MKKLIFSLLCLSLVANTLLAQADYRLAGPYEVVARDGQYRHSKGGSERDMKAALECAQSGHTDKALEIINAYAKTLQRLDGHDAPLCAIQCYDLVRAMTLMKAHRTAQWDDMVRRAMLPMMEQFEADSPYANGHWGAIVNRLRIACGIYLEEKFMLQIILMLLEQCFLIFIV